MPEKMPPPVILAMNVCDAIWIEPKSTKACLLGLFSEIVATSFPITHPLLAVHLCMTDAHGNVPLKLTLVDADEEQEPLAEREIEVDFPGRGAIIDVYAHLKDILFPGPANFVCNCLFVKSSSWNAASSFARR